MSDRSREARALDGTGEAYRELGRPLEALDFHRAAAVVHRELGDQWQLAVALENIVLAIRRAGSDDNVLPYVREALSVLEQLDDPRAHAARARITAASEKTLEALSSQSGRPLTIGDVCMKVRTTARGDGMVRRARQQGQAVLTVLDRLDAPEAVLLGPVFPSEGSA